MSTKVRLLYLDHFLQIWQQICNYLTVTQDVTLMQYQKA